MRNSLMRKNRKRTLHHPEIVTAGSLVNGRHLEPGAIRMARTWCDKRYKELSSRSVSSLSNKERHLLQRLEPGHLKSKIRASISKKDVLDYSKSSAVK